MRNKDKISSGEISAILSSLKAEARKRFKAEIKGIFGSYVRGEQKEGSDLDVLVEFEEGANLLDLVGLAIFLEEKLKLKVDVVPESALRKEIKDIVLRGKVAV
ncbi:MAG: nucleotidyltransferase family protein [Nitrospirae bacterium]|nr:nucleotidyltransferase family protein [Nitrospirota bacterium]